MVLSILQIILRNQTKAGKVATKLISNDMYIGKMKRIFLEENTVILFCIARRPHQKNIPKTLHAKISVIGLL